MKRQLVGLSLLGLGVLVLLQVLGIYNFGLAFWPVVLLSLGLAIIGKSIDGRCFGGPFSWIGLGIGLWIGGIGLFNILASAGVSNLRGSDIAGYGWPILLVALGLSILFGNRSSVAPGNWFKSGSDSDSSFDRGGWTSHSGMHRIGDLYHGRNPWVLDTDHDFSHGIGDVVVDLTTAEIKPGMHNIYIKVGIGDVTIRVPDGVNLKVDGAVSVGEINVFGDERSGFGGLSLMRTVEVEDAQATVQIEARLSIGDMNVQYMPTVSGVLR